MKNQAVIGEPMTGVFQAAAAHGTGLALPDVDVQFLNYLRWIVDIAARKAETLIDELLASVGFGVGLGHRLGRVFSDATRMWRRSLAR